MRAQPWAHHGPMGAQAWARHGPMGPKPWPIMGPCGTCFLGWPQVVRDDFHHQYVPTYGVQLPNTRRMRAHPWTHVRAQCEPHMETLLGPTYSGSMGEKIFQECVLSKQALQITNSEKTASVNTVKVFNARILSERNCLMRENVCRPAIRMVNVYVHQAKH